MKLDTREWKWAQKSAAHYMGIVDRVKERVDAVEHPSRVVRGVRRFLAAGVAAYETWQDKGVRASLKVWLKTLRKD